MMRRRGVSLVELMVSTMLFGMIFVAALPVLTISRNMICRASKREAGFMAGDAIFEYVANEMRFADRIWIGDGKEEKPPGEENWNAIYVERTLMVREGTSVTEETHGRPVFSDRFMDFAELKLEIRVMGRSDLSLTVRLEDESEILYERTELFSVLNMTLNEDCHIEGNAEAGEGASPVLWYQKKEERDCE
ncbi:type II secretion system protein [Lachnospiraceae bacterium 45-P1]